MENKKRELSGVFSVKRFLKSLLGYSMASWVQAVIAFISIPIVTRVFSTEQYGKLNMLILAINMMSVVVLFSTDQSYIRYFHEQEEQPRRNFLTLCVLINLCIFIILYVGLIGFYPFISTWLIGEINRPVILVFLPCVVFFTVFSNYPRIYFKMENLIGWYFVYSLIITFANKLAMLMAAFTTPDYTHAMAYMAVSFTLGFLLIYLLKKDSFSLNKPCLKRESLATIFKYSLPFLPTTLLLYFNNAVSSFILKSSFSYDMLAIYSATLSITNIMALFQSGFAIYWGPFVYQNYSTQQNTIKKIHEWLAFVISFIILCVMLGSDLLFYILGPAYRSGKSIFALLLLPHALTIIAETTCYGIYIEKKTYLQIYASLLSVVGNITLSILLIPRLGLIGAALANALGAIVSFFMRTYFGQREYQSTQNFWRTVLALSLIFAGGILNYCLINYILLKDISVAVLLVCLCFIYRGEIFTLLRNGRQFLHRGN